MRARGFQQIVFIKAVPDALDERKTPSADHIATAGSAIAKRKNLRRVAKEIDRDAEERSGIDCAGQVHRDIRHHQAARFVAFRSERKRVPRANGIWRVTTGKAPLEMKRPASRCAQDGLWECGLEQLGSGSLCSVQCGLGLCGAYQDGIDRRTQDILDFRIFRNARR